VDSKRYVLLTFVASQLYMGTVYAQTNSPCGTVKQCADTMVATANQLLKQNEELSKRVGVLEAELASLKNAVVAFNTGDKCPDGWLPFDDGIARVIIGAGQTEGLSLRRYAETGGNETAVLKYTNLPPFTVLKVSYNAGSGGAFNTITDLVAGLKDYNEAQPHSSYVVGGNTITPHHDADPIGIMPPYIALYLCKRN
jgi:hypothetical protein